MQLSIILPLLVTPVVLVLAARGEHARIVRGEDGWHSLRPVPVMSALGVLCVPLASFSIMLIASANTALAGLLMACVSIGGLYMTFFMRFRFNENGIEYQGVARTVFAPWEEITRVGFHPILGLQVRARNSTIPVPRYFSGVYQFMEEAVSRH